MEIHFHGFSHLGASKLLSPMIYVSFFLLVPFATAINFETTTFNFTSFDQNSWQNITFEGDASTSDQVIQLTRNRQDKRLDWSVGRATYQYPMHLWDEASGNLADFTTHFSFVIDSSGQSTYADGFAFFLAPNGSNLPHNSTGQWLGLVSRNPLYNTRKTFFVAVEFDTFYNEGIDQIEDNHVGIDVNSINSAKNVTWQWSNIPNGAKAYAWISYNSTSKNLSVLLSDSDDVSINGNISSLSIVMDLKEYLPEWVTFGFSAATGLWFETHCIYSWNFSSSLQIPANVSNPTSIPVAVSPSPAISRTRRRKRSEIRLWLALGVGACGLVGFVLGLVWFSCWMKRNRRANKDDHVSMEEEFGKVMGPRQFSYDELVVATNNFADEGKLGEGGFGGVYEGFLSDLNANVAVKRITPESRQGMKEYASEVKTISRLRHRNLVQLFGWCHEKNELLIIYEFMPNKSLDFHLFKEGCVLTWEKRYRIAQGLASALFYLQEECEQCVLHRDIKSSNVLLDLNFNAKLGDFGLARLVDHGQGSETTTLIGTRGYMALEYLQSGKAIKESDIYSFGIVALEIACGKRAIEVVRENGKTFEIKLVEHVWERYGRGNVLETADPRLCQNYDEELMERLIVVGLSCAHPNHINRPSIRLVVDMLNSKAQLPTLPSEMPMPTYSAPQVNVSAFSTSSSHGASGTESGQNQFSSTSHNTDSSKVAASSTASVEIKSGTLNYVDSSKATTCFIASDTNEHGIAFS